MAVGRPSKLPEILANNELKEKLVEMAKDGASLCQLYVEMGISKSTGNEWKDRNSEYYSREFSDFISELQTYAQAYWEGLGRDCLTWEKFQATVYNKQMQGRFKDDWRDSHHVENTGNLTINVQKAFKDE